ncbi:MAG TPA: hypothetical protein PLC36_02990 [Flavobacterium sp.]|nr:hypothetical protein [Flavobacterium sp.]HQX02642.1 hypothetical protein [Flavobacterium sp.]
MKNLLLLVIFTTHLSFAQDKVSTYKFGQNGMELIARSPSGTVIISTFNAKMTIRQDIARKIYDLYKDHKISGNTRLTVYGKEAKVMGKCYIKTKNNLTSVEFYYEKVNWNNGLVEVYENIKTSHDVLAMKTN